MDPRRFLILAAGGILLSGCALLRPSGPSPTRVVAPPSIAIEAPAPQGLIGSGAVSDPGTATPDPLEPERPSPEVFRSPEPTEASAPAPVQARLEPGASASSHSRGAQDRRDGAIRIFDWSPGRVYAVRTAPLRVTTLTLDAGETLVAKAAGDTVRWQIGEAVSGTGQAQRTHVLLKPLERGLETNLVLTTSRRVLFLELTSGPASAFDPAVSWEDRNADATPAVAVSSEPIRVPDPVVTPDGPLDARYRIEPRGRRPRWTPTTVFNDGRRTFIAFNADLAIDEAPTLFVIGPDGGRQMVNYRQSGGLFIADRVFDRAELRLGDRRPQIVRLQRLQGVRP